MSTALPVTVVVSRMPVAGREAELLAWAEGITAAASSFAGHQGAQIYAPDPPAREDLVIVFSFSDSASLQAWERSAERRDWLRRADEWALGELRTHAVSGFEGLFAGAPGHAVVPPPRWKTAVIIALALYPMSVLLNWLLAPHVSSWSIWLRVLLTTAIIVPYMAWVGVPYLTRWLRPWLRPSAR